jgi:hypothetical protein
MSLAEETMAAATPTGPVAEPETKAAPKVKTRKVKQRSCDEKNEKGKLCGGHLKRWFEYPAEIETLIGKGAEIYRCEFCQTLYKPDPQQQPNSYTVRF